MFARIKKSGQYQYLQIVENSKIDGKVRQRVVSTVGRLDQLQTKGSLETLRDLEINKQPTPEEPVVYTFSS